MIIKFLVLKFIPPFCFPQGGNGKSGTPSPLGESWEEGKYPLKNNYGQRT